MKTRVWALTALLMTVFSFVADGKLQVVPPQTTIEIFPYVVDVPRTGLGITAVPTFRERMVTWLYDNHGDPAKAPPGVTPLPRESAAVSVSQMLETSEFPSYNGIYEPNGSYKGQRVCWGYVIRCQGFTTLSNLTVRFKDPTMNLSTKPGDLKFESEGAGYNSQTGEWFWSGNTNIVDVIVGAGKNARLFVLPNSGNTPEEKIHNTITIRSAWCPYDLTCYFMIENVTNSLSYKVYGQAPVTVTSFSLENSQVILTGTNGVPAGGGYYVETSTNSVDWIPFRNGQFNADGSFLFTEAVDAAVPQQFFRIKLP